jgi:hypothetical protein
MKKMIAAAALLLATGAPSYAQNADITGKWDVTVSTAQGAMPPSTMVLKKDGDKIVGVISGPQGDIGVDAEVKDKAVALYASIATPQGNIDITFTGTVDGNAMKGTVDFGGRGGGDFTATRGAAPAAAAQDKVDVSGTWAFEVTTDFGTGSSTMVFKQDGEKLTGTYSGQYGEAALAGTVKGKDVTFSYQLVRESVTVYVTYTGTIDKDTMKGTLSIADMGNGSFTAKKTK